MELVRTQMWRIEVGHRRTRSRLELARTLVVPEWRLGHKLSCRLGLGMEQQRWMELQTCSRSRQQQRRSCCPIRFRSCPSCRHCVVVLWLSNRQHEESHRHYHEYLPRAVPARAMTDTITERILMFVELMVAD